MRLRVIKLGLNICLHACVSPSRWSKCVPQLGGCLAAPLYVVLLVCPPCLSLLSQLRCRHLAVCFCCWQGVCDFELSSPPVGSVGLRWSFLDACKCFCLASRWRTACALCGFCGVVWHMYTLKAEGCARLQYSCESVCSAHHDCVSMPIMLSLLCG